MADVLHDVARQPWLGCEGDELDATLGKVVVRKRMMGLHIPSPGEGVGLGGVLAVCERDVTHGVLEDVLGWRACVQADDTQGGGE